MSVLDVYTRRGCHLCEVLIEELLPIAEGKIEVRIRDIDTEPGLRAVYDTRVPVVEYDNRLVCEYQLDREKLQILLRQLPLKG